jgi:hypothetical protein
MIAARPPCDHRLSSQRIAAAQPRFHQVVAVVWLMLADAVAPTTCSAAGGTGTTIDNRAAEDRAGCMSLTAAPMHRGLAR